MSAPPTQASTGPPPQQLQQPQPQPLRSALKNEDDPERSSPASGSSKAVQIAEPESETQLDDGVQPVKQFPAGLGRRLSGKLPPSQLPNSSSRSSLSESSASARPVTEDAPHASSHHHSHRRQYYSEKLLAQVGDWLEHERKKALSRKKKPRGRKSPPKHQKEKHEHAQAPVEAQEAPAQDGRPRAESIDSQSSDVSFDRLQRILEDSMGHLGLNAVPHFSPKIGRPRDRKTPSRGSLHRNASSDTDYVDGDAIVPGCDAWLDNSRTMSYSGGNASAEDVTSTGNKADKEKEAWLSFKNEIIRIAHTLRLKGWRRVPLGAGDTISVERLSGALTNAVYVVSPPADLPELDGKRPPPKVLLRVYGPQVEHLIDRDNELQVLKRLARKKIGPRLLGTFKNGRFEQFFNAVALTPADFRLPDVMKQIAKRMRELHDGIELLPHEREAGPGVWKNWDQWLENVERIATFLDKQYETSDKNVQHDSIVHGWKASGYVCGAPWPQFKEVVHKYRAQLDSFYHGPEDVKKQLVFAHSDTQYGNILRVRPDDEKSPLLQPANEHKQLIVIDFEYAGANTPGVEFANHFTEWAYNYHDPVVPHGCDTRRYPTIDQQRLFLTAYVNHRPKFPHGGPSTPRLTPRLAPSDSDFSTGTSTPAPTPAVNTSTSSIVDFMLDARVPPGGWTTAERAQEEQSEQQVRELMEETRRWRPANHAQWIAWGLVQAQIPGLDDNSPKEEDIPPDEFNYLSYAQERAMFFWGDVVQLGLVKVDELPEGVRDMLKIVEV
ncbi:Fc.00g059260.m01.CDS01 [Cosmosporella sp. VM-42]